jgi:GH35 family endo-1,4-beta-xylanase
MTTTPTTIAPILRNLSGVLLLATSISSSNAEPSDMDASIRANRTGTIVVETAPGAMVRVEQTRHEFWFGAALANQAFDGRMPAADAARYKEAFLHNFNSAVTENALKWLSMERTRGSVDYATVDAMLDWTDANSIPLRGHNIYWGIPNRVQDWEKAMDDPTLHRTLEARGRDIGKRYRGRFAEYDLNNEMIHANYYADRFGPGITFEMAQWVKDEDPDAVLYLNDYDILTGKRLDDYVTHIRELLAMGAPIAGIGVQGHLHAESFDRKVLQDSLDVLAQFKLPIRVTEFNLPGQRSAFLENRSRVMTDAEEDAKARDTVDYYRICFAHPAVTGILMWGFWEGANWIPASSLYKRDWTPTPAAQAYHDLIYKEWWTHWEGVADADGRCEVPAFFGTHRVTAGDRQVSVELRKSVGTATAGLR